MSTDSKFRLMDPILPGNQALTGNGDKYSIDWWENGLLKKNEQIYEGDINAKMHEQTPGANLATPSDNEYLTATQVPYPRQRAKISVVNFFGQLPAGTTVRVPTLENTRVVIITSSGSLSPLYITRSEILPTTVNISDLIANNIQSAGMGSSVIIPVREQTLDLYISSSALNDVQIKIFSGDFDIDEFIMRHG